MRRFALVSFLGFAPIASAACGGAGDVPVAQPEQAAAESRPDGGPAAQPEQTPTALPESAPAVEAQPAAPAAPAAPGKGPERPILGSEKGAQGPTEFPHWEHQRAEVKCAVCHHAGSGGRSCGRGADCHQATEVNAPSARDAFHAACRPCHKKKGFPTGCDFCHEPKAG
jgi:hypothetical protein